MAQKERKAALDEREEMATETYHEKNKRKLVEKEVSHWNKGGGEGGREGGREGKKGRKGEKRWRPHRVLCCR